MAKLLKFKDLKFVRHHSLMPDQPDEDGLKASITFPNGYGISVVRFKMPKVTWSPELEELINRVDCMLKQLDQANIERLKYGSYTRNDNEWEVAILRNDEMIDVIGYQSPIEVTALMIKYQLMK